MSLQMNCELFIAKMPEQIQNNLIVLRNVPLDELAMIADRMVSRGNESSDATSLFAINNQNARVVE